MKNAFKTSGSIFEQYKFMSCQVLYKEIDNTLSVSIFYEVLLFSIL